MRAPLHPALLGSARLSPPVLQEALVHYIEHPGLTVTVDTQNLSATELGRLTAKLRENPASMASGMTLPARHADVNIFTRLTTISAADPEGPSLYKSFWGLMRELPDPPAYNRLSEKLEIEAERQEPSWLCSERISGAMPDLDRSLIGRLCEAAWSMTNDIKGETGALRAARFRFSEEASHCSPWCTAVARTDRDGLALMYVVTMQGLSPVKRVVVASTRDASLRVFLNARGGYEGSIMRERRALPREAAALLENRRIVFDYRWDEMGRSTSTLGDRDAMVNALRITDDCALVTDAPDRAPLLAPVVGLLVDTGINPHIPGLRSHLNIPSNALDTDANEEDLATFMYPGQTTAALASALVDEDQHGSHVASVMVANLPNARLSYLSANDPTDYPMDNHLLGRWISHIEASKARVVNISINYAPDVAECEPFFGALFDALPDVVFIVGAANGGAQNPRGSCPAACGESRDNVLTVAGTDGKRLHRLSNYGTQVAKVAAPYRGIAARLAWPEDGEEPGSVEMHGTSYSSAFVSNAVLRMFAKLPNLTATEAISLVMSACDRTGLDVACGGAIDFSKLEGAR